MQITTADLTTKQRLARLGYTVGERAGTYRRRIIAPDGSDLGPMSAQEANEMLARLEAEQRPGQKVLL